MNSFLVHSFRLGIHVTFIYDIIRIFRRVVTHRKALVSVEDFCFWVYCGVEIFRLMHRESNGVLRWYAVAGALIGMLLYRKIASRLLIKYAVKGLTKAVKLFRMILKRQREG